MKKAILYLSIVLVSCFSIVSCGGGGSSGNAVVEQPTPDNFLMPVEFQYDVRQVGQLQSNSGVGFFTGESIYFYPTVLSNSGFTVSARMDIAFDEATKSITADLSQFSYSNWALYRQASNISLNYIDDNHWLGSFIENGVEFEINLTGIGQATGDSSLSQIDGDWYRVQNSLDVKELHLFHSDGQLSGYTSSGCNVNGLIQKSSGLVYSVDVDLSGCDEQGEYNGIAVHKDNGISNKVYVSISNDSMGVYSGYEVYL